MTGSPLRARPRLPPDGPEAFPTCSQ